MKVAVAWPLASVVLLLLSNVARPEMTLHATFSPGAGLLLPSRSSSTIGCPPALPGRPDWPSPETIRAWLKSSLVETVNCTCCNAASLATNCEVTPPEP